MSNTIQSCVCLNCGQSEENVPLVSIRFAGQPNWVCSQCMPFLIHHPEQLAEKLPGPPHQPRPRS